MSDTNQPGLTDHAYDGIQEYDNPTPGWWTWLFIGSCVFGALYWAIATFSNGGLSAERELALDKAEETVRQFAEIGELKPDAATIIKYSHDEKWKAFGEGIFISKCMTCHNRDGSGGTGPNLTDDNYINVKKVEDIFDVIEKGRNNGAMPSWRTTLNQNEMVIVASYVAGLRGQNKPGKAPEPNSAKAEPWTAQ